MPPAAVARGLAPVLLAVLAAGLAGCSLLPPRGAPAAAPAGDGRPARAFPRAPALEVPAGFRAEVFATGLVRPTALAYGPGRRLYATEERGAVVVVPPGTKRPRVVASGFPTPLGLAWRGQTLYVSAQGRVERLRLRGGRLVARRTVVSGLPFGLHQQDAVVVGRDGRLYLGSGSTCNACREGDRRSAAILSFRPDGSDLRVVATGLRNPFGLAFQPGTGRLYASENGRDDLGDAEPAESVVVVRHGRRFGWPACWPSFRERRLQGSCGGVTPPAAYLEPHSSADGLAFYTGDSFPARFRGDLFVALWGEYASRRHGRRVVRVRLDERGNARPRGVSTFADGFEHPLALAVDPRGALLVADWGRGAIYRIQAAGKP